MHHHAQLVFEFLVETDFHHVGQAGLDLLTSSDLPASASQNAGITGVSHDVRLDSFLFKTIWLSLYHLHDSASSVQCLNMGSWLLSHIGFC